MEMAFETQATSAPATPLRLSTGADGAPSRAGSRPGSRHNSVAPQVVRGRVAFSPNTSQDMSGGGGGSTYESALTAPEIAVSAGGLPPIYFTKR